MSSFLALPLLLRTQTRCLEENDEKHEREGKIKMKKANREATIGIPEDYAEELNPCETEMRVE